MIVLVGCGNASPGKSTKSHPATPTATRTPTPTPTPTTTAAQNADWTTYHGNNARTGYLATMSDPHKLTRAWKARLDGAVYGSPLVIGGHVIVVTEADSLYSLDMHTGQVLWHTSVGQPVPLSTLPCGDIDPLGITSTPVYDPATRLVFAVAEVSGPEHILVGVDVDTGELQLRRLADPPGMDPRAQQQRAALALSQGVVYIGYGGLAGDCGDYHGWVVGLRTDGQSAMLAYQVPTTREGGIWGPSGPAVDADGNIYVATGNGAATQGNWDHSDSVLRLSPQLELEDGFAPTTWQQENANDEDLGSMGPLLLPGGLIFADGKSGNGYLLKANHLGGIGGQALGMPVCISFGGAAAVGSTIFIPCRHGLLQAQVGPGISLKLGWQARKVVTGSPVVGGHTVYSLFADQGLLYAFNMNTGALIAQVRVGKASHFATPALYGNYIFVGSFKGVAAVIVS
jgi:outer membrane protein assembly factor BamB